MVYACREIFACAYTQAGSDCHIDLPSQLNSKDTYIESPKHRFWTFQTAAVSFCLLCNNFCGFVFGNALGSGIVN